MQVRVLLFASYRDLAGTGEVALDVPVGATAGDAVAALRAAGNGFVRLPARPALAVNREYAGADTLLREGDEIALLPPIAGG